MPEETPTQKDNLADFIETISRSDGELIPLPARRSKLGEPYFLSVRYGQDEVETDYRYLIVDVLVQRGDRFVPVGIYDWEITGETALGNKQRHGHLPALNPAQEAADRYWSTGEGFHVIDKTFLTHAGETGGLEGMSALRAAGVIKNEEQWMKPIYQGEGLGSLLIAVSAVALNRQGIGEMSLGSLSEMAKRAWETFDRGGRSRIPTQELANHPKTRDAIGRFISP